MSKDYITIKEYAELRGCSTSAVYKRLTNTLKPYLIIENGKRYLKKQILIDEELLTPPQPSSSTPPQPSTQRANEEVVIEVKDNKEVIQDSDNKIILLLEKQIEDLKEQLKKQEEKTREEINFLRNQIEVKDRLIDQQQQLNAMTLEQNKSLTEPTEKNIIEENKTGFFKKLFG